MWEGGTRRGGGEERLKKATIFNFDNLSPSILVMTM